MVATEAVVIAGWPVVVAALNHVVVRLVSHEWRRAAVVPSRPCCQLSRGVWRQDVGVMLRPSVELVG